MKKILVILGHPDSKSFNEALFQSYVQSLSAKSTIYETIELPKLKFNPNLEYGYRKRTELEPDLIECQRKIKWADHIVLFFPLWWGSMPALLKGFFDRILLPGFAFMKKEDSVWWDKYLKGRTGRIIVTMDQPPLYFRFAFKRPAYQAVKKMTFQFVGINKVKYNPIGIIRNSSDAKRKHWLKKIEGFAKRDSK